MNNESKINILLIEDEAFDVRRVENTIKLFEQKIVIKDIVSNGIDAIDLLKNDPYAYSVIIMDYQIAGALKGEELIKEIKNIDFCIQIIVITKLTIDMTDFEFANRLLNAGAFWYCTKYPGDIEKYIYQPTDFLMGIYNAYEKRELEKQSYKTEKRLKQNIDEILNLKKIIGSSNHIRNIETQINKLSDSDITVLITGDSGTGKELVANNIHFRSKRKFEKIVPINCGSLPPDLIESELFGYEKGAFTGAHSKKPGLFEIANNGTVFLDEVSELPPSAQVKLLRVIQDGEIEKIGRTKRLKVDVRIIAATNKNLKELVEQNKFREDLYYRLNVVPLNLLPIRDRVEDIPLLFEHYLLLFSQDMGIEYPTIDNDAMKILCEYGWRGNVRELKNVVQRLLFYGDKKINTNVVQNSLLDRLKDSTSANGIFNFNTPNQITSLREMERLFRENYFKFVRDNSSSDADAAKKLGLAPPNYYRMSKELGLK